MLEPPFHPVPPVAVRGRGDRGVRVLVLRPEDPEERLGEGLRAAGYEVVACPLTRIEPPADPRPLQRSIRTLRTGGFEVLLLTSARAAEAVAAVLDEDGPPLPEAVEVWAVGEATARAAERLGLPVDRVPRTFVAEGLLAEAPAWRSLEGLSLLFPRAETGRELLPAALASAGVRVTLVAAYRNVERPGAALEAATLVRGGEVGAVLLTAGSQARLLSEGLKALHPSGGTPARGTPGGALPPLFALGSATRAAALAAGLPRPHVADPHTFEGLLALLQRVLPP